MGSPLTNRNISSTRIFLQSIILSVQCFQWLALKRRKNDLVNHHALPSAPKIVSDLSALAYHGMDRQYNSKFDRKWWFFFKINLDFYVFIKKNPYTSGLTKRIKLEQGVFQFPCCTGLISKPLLIKVFIVIGFIKIREMKQHL